ncbi:hypothetical protein AYO42_00915 [Rhizomicrobium sp. SCGC AG-212-E05]|nr:hypothetical protein AYO42_00915 [Rhizomicrobium sp. SCGC AG-212-E05]
MGYVSHNGGKMSARYIIIFVMFAISSGPSYSQQHPDEQADTKVARPAFDPNSGPVVAVDSGHHNYHTIDNRYSPFATLLRKDGFRVVDHANKFDAQSLANISILVISNALPPALVGKWNLPTSSAFDPAEIAALKTWVSEGGSLLLIADHLPFAGCARDLALAFGFHFEDGVVGRDRLDGRPDIFTKADGTLRDDVTTRGRDPEEVITALRTFTGSAFRAPPIARPIIVLPPGYSVHKCGLPCPPGASRGNVSGYLQGALLTEGKGRIAVFGEAAMFSAQVVPSATPPFRMGFNAPRAEQNKQFILNLMRWLAGTLPD